MVAVLTALIVLTIALVACLLTAAVIIARSSRPQYRRTTAPQPKQHRIPVGIPR